MPLQFLTKEGKNMGMRCFPTNAGLSTEILNVMDELQRVLDEENVKMPVGSKCLKSDCKWLCKVLDQNRSIRYVRVVKNEPRDAKFAVRRWYFDTYLVKRKAPNGYGNCIMLYLQPIAR